MDHVRAAMWQSSAISPCATSWHGCRLHDEIDVQYLLNHSTPAMDAGVSDHCWDLYEIVGLLTQCEAQASN